MSSEKEWIARCLNLAQTERDSMKAVNIAFDRTSDLLNREERERLNACFKNFVTKDTQFYRQFDEITNRISSLRPHERTFKDKLNRLEKESLRCEFKVLHNSKKMLEVTAKFWVIFVHVKNNLLSYKHPQLDKRYQNMKTFFIDL